MKEMIFRQGDEYVAMDTHAVVHAFGATEAEARANLVAERDDLRRDLNALDDQHLTPRLRVLRDRLNQWHQEQT